jgi:hypothetical protein
MDTRVAVNDMTRVRLRESPGPGHGHRGFLVQRNHESGGIVIVYSLPERCGFGNSATSTFRNCDIFTIPKFGQVIFKSGHWRKTPGQYPPEPARTFRVTRTQS